MIVEGVLNINKPSGWTSHDVVARIRKLLETKKIGHAGTLDPGATGVLVICVGKATKIVEYLVAMDKEYEVIMRLGETTETQDASGLILEKKPWEKVTDEDILQCFTAFTGEISQVPPSFSAIKIRGIPSYKLARAGKEVNISPRNVMLYKISYKRREGADIFFQVHCSKGTYIRTLCHDMGIRLGTGAHLYFLKRLRSGMFDLEDSVTLEELSEIVADGRIESEVYKMDEVMANYPSIDIEDDGEEKIRHGHPISLSSDFESSIPSGSLIRLKNKNGSLIALGILQGEDIKKIKIEKVLTQQERS